MTGLERTIRTDKATIDQLGERITRLELGEDVRSLKDQLDESQKRLQVSAKEMRDMKKQLKDQKKEKENLQGTIKARDKKIKEEGEKSSKEKEDLKKQLEQAKRIPDRGLEEEARKLGEQKKKLTRELREAEQKVCNETQRLEEEKKRTTAEHQKAIKEKDEEIHRLGRTVQDAREGADTTTEEAGKEEDRFGAGGDQQHEKDRKEAVQKAVQKAAEDARNKERQYEKEKKDVVEKAVEKAAEDARQKHQKQLDDEIESSREAQEKAHKTESALRTEIGALKSQVEKAAESTSADLADPQPGKDTTESTVLARETNEANNLLLEIERNGIVQGTVDHNILQELNSAKLALYNVKVELQKSHSIANKTDLDNILYGIEINKYHIEQLNTTKQAVMVGQAKAANSRLEKLREILKASDDVQKDAILEVLHNPVPREIKKARSLKQHMQPGPGMLPSNSQTNVQAGNSMGQFQQTNGNPEQHYDPRLVNMPRDVQPRFPAGTSQDNIAPTLFGGVTNGFATQSQVDATPESTPIQGAPGSASDGSSSLMPQNQGEQPRGTLGFDFSAIDTSHPIWKGINFGKQNEASEGPDATKSTNVPQGSVNTEASSAPYTPSIGFRLGKPPAFSSG